MKINTSHLVGAVIALTAVFFSKLDAQIPFKADAEWQGERWEYATVKISDFGDLSRPRSVYFYGPSRPEGVKGTGEEKAKDMPHGLPSDISRAEYDSAKIMNLMGNQGWEIYDRTTEDLLNLPETGPYNWKIEIFHFKRPKQ